MTDRRLYLDHNATTPLRPEARAAMLAVLDHAGAASSVHAEGRAARHIVEEARAEVAALVGALPKNVVFVSGATEANVTALSPHWQRGADRRSLDVCLVSAIEHASVGAGARFATQDVETLPVQHDGRADVAVWSSRLDAIEGAGRRPLVSLMLANNETGAMQPVRAIADKVHAVGGILHSDAAQAAGKVPVSIAELGADLLTLSSHKLGGPLGAGALVLASDGLHLADPLIRGGGQEKGARAGTENVPAIAGFGAAARAARTSLEAEGVRLRGLRDRLETELAAIAPATAIFSAAVERLPNTTCFALPSVTAEIALMALDLGGIAVSSGSACSSGKVDASHVLAAMGIEAGLARCALRVSLGRTTTAEEVEFFLRAWNGLVQSIHVRHKDRAA